MIRILPPSIALTCIALTCMALLFLTSCGGGGGGSAPTSGSGGDMVIVPTPQPPENPFEVEILFPPESALTYDSSVTVASVADFPYGVIEFSAEIRDSNNQVVASASAFDGQFNMEIPLANGVNNFTLFAREAIQGSGSVTFSVERSPRPIYPVSPVFNPQSNTLLVLDGRRFLSGPDGLILSPTSMTLTEIDVTTGLRRIVSGPQRGSGPLYETPFLQVLDKSANRVLVYDVGNDNLISIDLQSGNRSLFVNFKDAAQLEHVSFRDMWLDEANNRVQIFTRGQGAWEVRLNDAQVNKLYDLNTFEFGFVDEDLYAPNALTNKAYYLAEGLNVIKLYNFNLSTGEVQENTPTVNSNDGNVTNGEINFQWVEAIVSDEQRQLLYIAGIRNEAPPKCGCDVPVIVRIDLLTGAYSDVLTLPNEIGSFASLELGAGNTLYAVDSAQDRVYEINAATGAYEIISDTARGIIRSDEETGILKYDATNERLFTEAANRDFEFRIQEVNLETGERPDYRVHAGEVETWPLLDEGSDFDTDGRLVWSTHNGLYRALLLDPTPELVVAYPEGSGVSRYCYDTPSGIAYAIGFFNEDNLITVDTKNGSFSTLQSEFALSGLGPPACDAANGKLYASDGNTPSLIAVDMNDGSIETISSSSVGSGPAFSYLRALSIDLKNQKIYGISTGDNTVIAVDIETGDREHLFAPPEDDTLALQRPGDTALLNERTLLVSDRRREDRIIAVDTMSGETVVLSN